MAQLNTESPFQSWVLSPEEFAAGTILTLTQKQNIQNQICALSLAKNNLEPNFSKEGKYKYLQQEAELRGQINALTHLISCSNEMEAALRNPQEPPSDSLVPNS